MNTSKKIVSAVAALTMLASVSGLTVFAGNALAKEPKQPEIVEEQPEEAAAEETEAAEEAEAEETEEAAEEEAAEAETEETVEEAPAEEADTEAEAVIEEVAEEAPEVIAETLEDIKPAKPIDKKAILEKIDEVFDAEKQDFKDDQAKADWFAFC